MTQIRSMTGFGRAQAETAAGRFTVELKSVNSRFQEIKIGLPPGMPELESPLRALLKSAAPRCKLDCRISFVPAPGFVSTARVNEEIILRYRDQLTALQKRLGAAEEGIPIEALLRLPGSLEATNEQIDAETLWKNMEPCARQALEDFQADRVREAGGLVAQMKEELARLSACREKIIAARDSIVARYRERLKARIAELEAETRGKVEPGRLEIEVALYADRCDVAEELVRLRVHLARFHEILGSPKEGGAGRALDFLLQEILREVNTTSSKLRDVEMIGETLEMKNAVERLREQIQNIE